MDDTSDTCWSWPHWKFGLKRDDLFQSLHLQYNTVSNPILDPEAFHHDVCELSHQATTADEFHRLLQDRKQQRLRELNESLESAALEIIANPSLIGTEQWHHAAQLFRTKSLDSLVRYFASYLPSDHAWYRSADSSSSSDTGSSVDSIADSQSSVFDCDAPTMTDEPFEFPTSIKELLPPSPRSMTMCSGSTAASPIDGHDDDDLPPLSPTRTLSISESELDRCATPEPQGSHDCERTSRTRAGSQPSVSISLGVDDTTPAHVEPEHDEGKLALPTPDIPRSDNSTPRAEVQSDMFLENSKASLRHRRYRSLSPSRPHPLSEDDLDHVIIAATAQRQHGPRSAQRTRFKREKGRERDCSPAVPRRRGCPLEPANHRIQKPLPDTASGRSRARGRRLVGEKDS
ncbi:hypothetical protein VTK26DRAFT_6562 [Humicola hyalothermophila]